MIAGIHHIDVGRTVHRDTLRFVKSRAGVRPIGIAPDPGHSRQSADRPVGSDQRDFPDRMVKIIGHVQIARPVSCHGHRPIKSRLTVRSISAAIVARQTRHAAHYARRGDPSDGMVPGIREIQIAGAVHGHSLRLVKLRAAVGTVETSRDAEQSSQGTHDARRSDFADGRVGGVRHIDISSSIHRNSLRTVKPRGARQSITAAVVAGGTGQSGHQSCGGHFANRAVLRIRDINVSSAGHRNC